MCGVQCHDTLNRIVHIVFQSIIGSHDIHTGEYTPQLHVNSLTLTGCPQETCLYRGSGHIDAMTPLTLLSSSMSIHVWEAASMCRQSAVVPVVHEQIGTYRNSRTPLLKFVRQHTLQNEDTFEISVSTVKPQANGRSVR